MRVEPEQVRTILNLAEVLAGEPLGEQGELLTAAACSVACSCCCREDIPVDMEPAVAQLVLALRSRGGEGDVKSITRGDTAITYGEAGKQLRECLSLLAPFRRLGRLKEERA